MSGFKNPLEARTTFSLPQAVDENVASDITGLSVSYLRQGRGDNPRTDGPPYFKMGRSVRYDLAELLAWREARRVDPSSHRYSESLVAGDAR